MQDIQRFVAVAAIRVQLAATSAITGRVLNENGAPLVGVFVTAMRVIYSQLAGTLRPCDAPAVGIFDQPGNDPPLRQARLPPARR